MSVVAFQNPGEIDERCISTIGVSVKEGDNPIGFFGTGLKYAIAIILRHGGSITIWKGLEPLKFTTREVSIRGRVSRVVCMNGVELGFTEDLGKHWELWQAFRELWCNAKDEGGDTTPAHVVPRADYTTIIVESAAFAQCHREMDRYILLTPPLVKSLGAGFHAGPVNTIFYKGINVGAIHPRPLRFAINLTKTLALTEDRTVKNHYEAHYLIAGAVLMCEDSAFIEDWVTSADSFAEHHIDLDWPAFTPGKAFLDAVGRVARDTSRPLNPSALAKMAKHMPIPDAADADVLPWERAALSKAIAFCRSLAYPVDEFPIVVVESLGNGVLGLASMQKRVVLVARRAIQMGDLTLAATLIEEWCHLKHGHTDCSREMQNWLFEQVTLLGKSLVESISSCREGR